MHGQPHIRYTAVPWSPHIRYLGPVLDSKLLFTKHLHAVTRFSPTFPPPRPPLNVTLTQQTHSLQATDPSHTHLYSPRL